MHDSASINDSWIASLSCGLAMDDTCLRGVRIALRTSFVNMVRLTVCWTSSLPMANKVFEEDKLNDYCMQTSSDEPLTNCPVRRKRRHSTEDGCAALTADHELQTP